MIFLDHLFELCQLLITDRFAGDKGEYEILGGACKNAIAQVFQFRLLNLLFGNQRRYNKTWLLSFQSTSERQSLDDGVGGIFFPMKRILRICCQR